MKDQFRIDEVVNSHTQSPAKLTQLQVCHHVGSSLRLYFSIQAKYHYRYAIVLKMTVVTCLCLYVHHLCLVCEHVNIS